MASIFLRKKLASIFVILAILEMFCLAKTIACPDTGFSWLACNLASYNSTDPYAKSVEYVIRDVQCKTPKQKSLIYFTKSPYDFKVAYGHAKCNSTLSAVDCAVCIGEAKVALLGECRNRYGAHIKLNECSLRYDQFRDDDVELTF